MCLRVGLCVCVFVCPIIIIDAFNRSPDVHVRDARDARRDGVLLLDEHGSAHGLLLSPDRESLCGQGI